MFYHTFDEDEGGSQVHVDGVFELFKRDVPYLRETLSMPSVGDEDVGYLVSMLLFDLFKEAFDLLGVCDVDLVDGDLKRRVCI